MQYRDPKNNRLQMSPAQEVDAVNDCIDNILADLRRPTKQLIRDMNTTAIEYVQKDNQETGEYIKKKKELIDQTVIFGREGNLFDTVSIMFKTETEIYKLIMAGLLASIR